MLEYKYDTQLLIEGTDLDEDKISEFITGLKANGSLDAIASKWFSTDESVKTIPSLEELPATKGTLVMATDGDYMPFFPADRCDSHILRILLGAIIGRIGINHNPKHRKPAHILKGVNTDDQN